YTGAELMSYEALGFCAPGESGPQLAAGIFNLGSELPTNPSGGLLGFGAPAGATGIAQAIEIFRQLQGTADPRRQVPGARCGLAECHGGTATIAVVHVFDRRD
ncbi:MAG: 3-ketoacyl-CoA thiolase, partial [Deinococcus sp.]|nr:3-ketoacyl-CoA thiolase [Deinococcus sp.]